MKILNISQNYHITGGSDSYMFALENLLSKNKHTCIPFCAKNPKNVTSQWEKFFPESFDFKSNSPKEALQYFYNLDAKNKIRELLNSEKIDIAHLHIYYGKITSSILSELKKRKIPTIQTLHEYKLVCPAYTLEYKGNVCEKCLNSSKLSCITQKCKNDSLIQSTARYLEYKVSRLLGDIKNIDKFISVSEFHRRKMIEGGISESKITTIHNFVDTQEINPSYSSEGYALYFGRVEALKGIKTLIDAAAITGTKLMIAGTGSDIDSFKSYAQSKSLDNVIFCGFKSGDELRTLIKNSCYVVVPSEWYENCPMTVLEAKAYGKPVIGAAIGGIPELINHNIDGYIFEPKNTEALAELMKLLDNQETLLRFSKASRLDAEKRFSAEHHYKMIKVTYEEFL